MKVLTVIGARPQFIKASCISAALRVTGIEEHVVHTGQHYDDRMSGSFFIELGLAPPAINLGIGSGPHGAQTGRMLEMIEAELLRIQPDWVVVYGDTNSTLAGALAAVKLHIPVAHVEAGLRSFNRRMPEEINRVLTDHISTRRYCPSATAVQNLAREGITTGVHVVGDVMYDSLLHFRTIAAQRSTAMKRLGITPGTFYLATVHRAENTADPARLRNLLTTLDALDAPVILPLHPRTRAVLPGADAFGTAALRLIEPVGYFDMLVLTENARTVLTDSGGLQKEAYWLGVPCITLREETEWTETLAHGWNQLVGLNRERIRRALLRRPDGDRATPYGNGDAAHRIVRELTTEPESE